MFKKQNIDVQGTFTKGFEGVKEAFQENFNNGDELSAQVCVVKKGEIVVDLWASCDTPSYTGDTVQTIWSSTKNLTALAIAMMVERKLLSYGDPVCRHWPEYAGADQAKAQVTIADILRHEGGMPVFSAQMKVEDCFRENAHNNNIGQIIEREPLNYPEGQYKREYHALTRGQILQEIFRRVEPQKRTIGQFLEETVFQPLDVNINIGLDEDKQKTKAIANVIGYTPEQVFMKAQEAGRVDIIGDLSEFKKQNETEGNRRNTSPPFENVSDAFDLRFWNGSAARRAELPSGGALATARSLAVTASHLAAGGGDLLSREAWQEMHAQPTEGFTFGMKTFFTQGGVNFFQDGYDVSSDQCNEQKYQYGQQVPRGLYGWGGFGGSVFLWDPEREISFAYVPTYLAWYDRSKKRGVKCLQALYKCL